MDRPRAADDFDTIHQRLDELRREREAVEAAPNGADNPEHKIDRRRRERLEGRPPPWAPTIFAKPTRR